MYAPHAVEYATSNIPNTAAALAFRQPRQLASYSPDSVIYSQGDRARGLFHVETGAVRICQMLADGRRQVVAFHLAGETFGFEVQREHSFFAEATVHTVLRKIDVSGDEFNEPELVALALRGLLRAQHHHLVLGQYCAAERLAAFLVDISERQGDSDILDLPMTRADIGDYLGMTTETVSRSFSKFRDERVLRLRNLRSVEILKPEKLRRLCQ